MGQFEEIVSFSNKYNYKEIQTEKPSTKVYLINNKYILKINSSKTKSEFESITSIIKFLNQNNFPTPKLLFSKFENNQSYFLFEYIENNHPITKTEMLNLIKQFHNMTKNLNYEFPSLINSIQNKLLPNFKSNQTHNNILIEILSEIKLNSKKTQIILTDINNSNFIQNNNNIYLIDFDEIHLGDLEFDISQIFLFESTFNLQIKFKSFLYNIKKYTNFNLNSNLIINYIIISLYQKILFYNKDKSIQSKYLNLSLEIINNKKTLEEKLQIFINKNYEK